MSARRLGGERSPSAVDAVPDTVVTGGGVGSLPQAANDPAIKQQATGMENIGLSMIERSREWFPRKPQHRFRAKLCRNRTKFS
jgi:hypothetical protein